VRRGRLALLVLLYAAQGMPFGFATTFVPLQLAHAADFTYSKTTLVHLAGFPWMLKMLWAPAVDTRYFGRLGRRKSWILPAQGLLASTALVASTLDFRGALAPILTAVLLFNLWASVQDTAVDALAIDLLPPEERGLGNAAQVGGYKLGMLVGGSGLVFVAHRAGPQTALLGLSLLFVLTMAVVAAFHEPPPGPTVEQKAHRRGTRALTEVLHHLVEPRWLGTLAFIATVKIGESMLGSILKPYAVRGLGRSDAEAAFAVGIVGGALSLTGSLVGGWLAGRMQRLRLLGLFGLLQAAGMMLLAVTIHIQASWPLLTVAIGVQHLAVGLLTPVLFAYMMDVTDPVLGATHYTLLATTELVAKSLALLVTGPLSDAVGVPTLAMLTGSVGALPLLLLPTLVRPPESARSAERLSTAA
jgi:PAT family beta-lactamase induction signal transducer AmpG